MKKAKIMLMAIAILGVVGGALAFKTSNAFNATNYTCATTVLGGPTICVKTTLAIVASGGVQTTIYKATSASAGTCVNTFAPVTYYCTSPTITQVVANAGE